jgi:N-acetylmuramoyl-L-alanine amidase
MKNLYNREVALVVGHTPHAGAEGEWDWNTTVAAFMVVELESLGIEVYSHKHTIQSYGARQDEMAKKVKYHLPNCEVVIELHYNAYSKSSANGHEFLFNATPSLSAALQKRFSNEYPWSVARSGGVKQRSSGDGAGFLIKAPAASCITEPFFITNPKEKEFFEGLAEEVAGIYVLGICDFLLGEPFNPDTEKPSLSVEARLDRLEDRVGI